MTFREHTTESMIPWVESLRFALKSLAAEKLKASLTTLAVVIGSAAIVLVVAIGSTGESYIVSLIEGIGTNLAYATLDRGSSTVLDDELTPSDLSAVRQTISAVHAIAGTYDVPVGLNTGGKTFGGRLVGVTSDFEKIRNLRITSGRYFDEDEYRARFKVCLITDNLAQSAFGSDPAVGNTVGFGDFRCTIIGTFIEGVPTFGRSEIQDPHLAHSISVGKGHHRRQLFPGLVYAGNSFERGCCRDSTDGAPVAQSSSEGSALLSRESDFSYRDGEQNFAGVSRCAFGGALLTLTVAGTGIMNIMFFNVSERTHEIGLRKALGATPAEIRLQFLLEALFISFTGAVAGVVAALALLVLVTSLVRNTVPLNISWTAALVAVLVPSAIGVLFGYRPASNAAKTKPNRSITNRIVQRKSSSGAQKQVPHCAR